jgi:hypothetical protein
MIFQLYDLESRKWVPHGEDDSIRVTVGDLTYEICEHHGDLGIRTNRGFLTVMPVAGNMVALREVLPLPKQEQQKP